MNPHPPPNRTLAAAIVGALLLIIPGCYKAEHEAEKARAAALQTKNAELEAALAATRSDLQAALGRSQTAESQLTSAHAAATLVTLADGRPHSQDSLKWDGQRWLRHGECTRPGGTIRFDNGKLVDGPIFFQGVTGRPLATGQVRNSRPEGEWVWFDAEGKPSFREVWKNGRLADVNRVNASAAVLTWDKLNRRDREAWARQSANSLRDLPELIRDLSPLPATAASPAVPAPKPPARTAR